MNAKTEIEKAPLSHRINVWVRKTAEFLYLKLSDTMRWANFIYKSQKEEDRDTKKKFLTEAIWGMAVAFLLTAGFWFISPWAALAYGMVILASNLAGFTMEFLAARARRAIEESIERTRAGLQGIMTPVTLPQS